MRSIFVSRALVGFFWVLSLVPRLTAAAAEADDTSLSSKVDALFETWNKPDTPGVVCAVMQDGEVVYARGFGMADLEHDVPLSPESVFYIASTSKQFTAASIALLSLDGKVTLDADIRTYLPEFVHLPAEVTVRHLVHHTSGIRDYFSLLMLRGWRDTDYFGNDMVVRLLSRQRALNFAPGSEHGYSNSNYVLLAEIVKRVTGESLRTISEQRIFRPLGMTQTAFDDDYRRIVKQRVISYLPKPDGGYLQLLKEFDGHGDGNLLTTVLDLARWEENFYTGAVGGQAFIDLVQRPGTLNDGTALSYAFGLICGRYRGLRTVRHGGGFKGFRTELLRFPDQHISVAVLSNLGSVNPSHLADKVADLFLAGSMEEASNNAASADPTSVAATIDPAIFDAYVGDFALEDQPGFVLSFTREGDRFYSQATRQQKFEIFPSSDNTFFYKVVDAQLTFHRESDGSVDRVTLHQGGNHLARRKVTFSISESQLVEYVGRYYSEELDTTYELVVDGGKLTFKHDALPPAPLEPVGPDAFHNHIRIVFTRDANGRISGLLFSGFRVRNLICARRP